MSIRKRSPRLASTPAARSGAKRIGRPKSEAGTQKTVAKSTTSPKKDAHQADQTKDAFEGHAFSSDKILGSAARTASRPTLGRQRKQGTRAGPDGSVIAERGECGT
ncbi:MAG: hypothetical protein GY822_05730 [Deltaproteobacteria bacterium]|nr:hypothetical protein [Deltaproteobacteria bacterium]